MMKKLVVFLLIAAVYIIHQDNWHWKSTEPMVFGFLPPGLAYHAAYSILAAVLMVILTKIAWPKHLDDQEKELTDRNPPPS